MGEVKLARLDIDVDRWTWWGLGISMVLVGLNPATWVPQVHLRGRRRSVASGARRDRWNLVHQIPRRGNQLKVMNAATGSGQHRPRTCCEPVGAGSCPMSLLRGKRHHAAPPVTPQSSSSTNRASSTASACTTSLSFGKEPDLTSARKAERARTRSSSIWTRSRLKSA